VFLAALGEFKLLEEGEVLEAGDERGVVRIFILLAMIVGLGGIVAAAAWANETAPDVSGQASGSTLAAVPTAQSLDGQDVAFADLLGSDGQAVCYTFLHPTCPLAQRYGPVLAELAAEFDEQGIRFVGVICEFDEPEEITRYRDEYAIHFPFVTDREFRLAEALDATTTPEVVLVDASGRTRYQGRIDDRYKVRGEKSPGTPEPDLERSTDRRCPRIRLDPTTK